MYNEKHLCSRHEAWLLCFIILQFSSSKHENTAFLISIKAVQIVKLSPPPHLLCKDSDSIINCSSDQFAKKWRHREHHLLPLASQKHVKDEGIGRNQG